MHEIADNGWLIVLLAFIVVGLPVILGVGGEMLKTWLKHKQAMADALHAQVAEKAAQYAAHTERLEQRVRVLERIATDRGAELSENIELLRERHPLN